MPVFIFILLLLIAGCGYWFWNARKVKQALLAKPLTNQQRNILKEAVPLYARVPIELREKLDGKINLFLHQVEFHGCNGLDVTEEMQLTIAAQACILIANKDMWYKNLRTILIYPGAFQSRRATRDGYIITEKTTVRIGESWSRGPVILSWAHASEGAFMDTDGHNVVLHEFAHQIDDLSGYTNGVPILSPDQKFDNWAHAFNAAYARLVEDVESGRKTVLDPYGATAPEEFFAVVVELFFERPLDLKTEEPEIYAQLQQFFQLEPATWH